jgi:hypothetical protein
MKTFLGICVWAAVLFLVTAGIGMFTFLFVDPWAGDSGGNNRIILLALPIVICFIAIPQFVPPPLGLIVAVGLGVLIQYLLCVFMVAVLYLAAHLFRGTR